VIASRACLAACVVLASAGIALANDSTGHLSAGGIVLGRSDDIEIRSEDLYVSTTEIRVRYRFFNTSDKDIATLVAFPMPDLPAPSDGDNLAVPVEGSANFMDFKTQVDGKPVDMQVEQRAVALGIDRTDLLKGLNVPLVPFDAATKAVQALAPEKQAELVGFGVLRSQQYDIGQGMKQYVHPNWTLRATYYWNQIFPAKKEIVVEHQYQPSVGGSVETMVGNPQGDATERETYRKRYCMDREFIAAAQRARNALKRGSEGKPLSEKRLEYILATGGNWAGPIKDFRLVIDKSADRNLISACGKFKKISATQFELRQTDYFPERNLEVLILEPLQ
jgi:uncharacterized protein DUF4424